MGSKMNPTTIGAFVVGAIVLVIAGADPAPAREAAARLASSLHVTLLEGAWPQAAVPGAATWSGRGEAAERLYPCLQRAIPGVGNAPEAREASRKENAGFGVKDGDAARGGGPVFVDQFEPAAGDSTRAVRLREGGKKAFTHTLAERLSRPFKRRDLAEHDLIFGDAIFGERRRARTSGGGGRRRAPDRRPAGARLRRRHTRRP